MIINDKKDESLVYMAYQLIEEYIRNPNDVFIAVIHDGRVMKITCPKDSFSKDVLADKLFRLFEEIKNSNDCEYCCEEYDPIYERDTGDE